MKWTTWWSVAITGLLLASCGGGSGGGGDSSSSVGSDSGVAEVKEVVDVGGSCSQLSGFFTELLDLTNKARNDAGLGDLRFSYQLGQAAQGYAQDLATQNFFSQTGKDGSTLRSRIAATGYQYSAAGENLAAGQTTAQSVFQGWWNSDGHRANILQSNFTEVGFGLYEARGTSDYGLYWVQNFGKPQSGSSSSEIYIPNNCSSSVASEDNVLNEVVAGISITNDRSHDGILRGDIQSGDTAEPFLAGTVPVNVVAAALASDEQAERVPEPSVLLGLGAVGLMLWHERFKGDA